MTKMWTTNALLLAAAIFRVHSLPPEIVTSTTPVARNITLNRHLNESHPNRSSTASVRIQTADADDGAQRINAKFTERSASNDGLEEGDWWGLQEAHNATSGCRHAGAAEAASTNNTRLSAGNARRRRRAGCNLRRASGDGGETAIVIDKGRGLVGHARGKLKKKKKLKKFLIPLLIAYKLKFFALVPLLISGLVLLVGATGAAGFFFALFAATISIKSHSKW
ncbi:uncharacterized protein LOC126354762 [Schistocerca gregaria]|uniref:uncharacterized protein LOC126354762 n=1 Tax=Schistocerca gregaria TaxID=7010 RepID=UPI00211E2E07|nr:uncharacterized protein LOC126354762 [Schistocerca gregaria]